MHTLPRLNRRSAIACLGTASLCLALPARAQSSLDATSLGVAGDTGSDQTAAVQQALDAAAAAGRTLILPPGTLLVQTLVVPATIAIAGSGNRTTLVAAGAAPIATITGATRVTLSDIGFSASATGPHLEINASDGVTLSRCQFSGGDGALHITGSAVRITDCDFADHADAAIHAANSRGLYISGNAIARCGNAGIRIWRDQRGSDGSIVTGNRITAIDWAGGGNGQNGNGINIFNADDVIVADNHLADCAFSAIRLNSTRNTQVSGNLCLGSGECAIFSEFAFSGSVIANNIVDGAATGISITNLDQEGHLAVCSGNIVRNITPASRVNPDTVPVGIYAEAETAISGNTVTNVPGAAIVAGYGPYLRNVLISGNVTADTDYGICVSVADGCGHVQIANNLISARKFALIGMKWQDIVSTDLAADAPNYPHVTLSGNG